MLYLLKLAPARAIADTEPSLFSSAESTMLKFFAYIFLGLIIAALVATFLLFMGA